MSAALEAYATLAIRAQQRSAHAYAAKCEMRPFPFLYTVAEREHALAHRDARIWLELYSNLERMLKTYPSYG